ncbi:MAG: hypothetical protein ACYC9M_07540 [Desulfobulbaceae bacterium]
MKEDFLLAKNGMVKNIMIKLINNKLLLITVYLICLATPCHAWKTNKGDPNKLGTHEQLTYYAAYQKSILKFCTPNNNANCNILASIGFDDGLEEYLKWNQNNQIWNWIILGADKEDAGRLDNMATNSARFNNHFHNPLKPWENAGLDDWILIPPFHLQGKSSLLWAQDSSYQSDSKWPEGDWTWERTRKYYYTALTSPSETGRQEFFARTFKGLGHQVHLLEDKSVPAHVRNDAHPLPWHIEKWLADNPNVIPCLIEDHEVLDAETLEDCMQKDENGEVVLDNEGNPVMKFPHVDVVIPDVLSRDANNLTLDPSYTNYYGSDRTLEKTALLTDTDQYNLGGSPSASYSIGLAEYTNGNFFSADTIFAERYDADDRHYFPNPSRAMTNLDDLENNNILPKFVVSEDDIPDGVKCIKKNSPGEEVDCLVRAGYLTNLVDGQNYATYERTFILDAPSHESYVKFLAPRAVGYATALIDYFFRGTLEISPPTEYVYSIIDGGNSPQQFTHIKANVRNTSVITAGTGASIPEATGDGELVAIAKYRIMPDYSEDLSSYPQSATDLGNAMQDVPFSYSVSESVAITSANSIQANVATEYLFDFSENPIPAGITDLYLQVVFRGTLGSEQNEAIAVGMRDLNEPQHLTFWNDTDYFLLYGTPVKAEDLESDPRVTWYGYIWPFSFTETLAFSIDYPDTAPAPVITLAGLPPARYSRVILLTDASDAEYYVTDQIFAQRPPPPLGDAPTTFNETWNYTLPSTTAQQDTDGNWLMSPVYTVRGVRQHQRTYLMGSYPYFVYINSLPAPPENDLGPHPATNHFVPTAP